MATAAHATARTQPRARAAVRAAVASRLQTLACGAAFGVLLGLSIALVGARRFTQSSAGSSSSSSGSSSSSQQQARALIRGGEGAAASPPQQQQKAGTLLKDVVWAAHDPVAGQIATDLWLRRDLTVYVLPSAAPRDSEHFFRKLLPGLLEHPRVIMTSDKEEADILLSIPFFTDEAHAELTASDWAKTIVVDNTDGFFAEHKTYRMAGHAFTDNYLAFFKRSFIKKTASRAEVVMAAKGGVDLPLCYWPYSRDFFPLSFAVEDEHLRALWDADSLLAWDDGAGRDVPVFSSLRPHPATFEGARANATRWLQEMDIEGIMVGKIDGGTRRKAGQQYFDRMRRAAIVVTANPGKWEGDFRLWEAMASKALVFVDELFAPMPCPLIHGQDLIFYDPYDRRSFEEKIRYYLAHPEEARRIAMSGFRKAVRCHRWVNRVDYIMSTAAYLLEPGFKESGIYLKETMMRTSGREFYGMTTRTPAKPAAETTEPSGAEGEGRRAHTAGVAPLSIEAYRSRIAAKVRAFEEEYWAMAAAWNQSRSIGAAEAAETRL